MKTVLTSDRALSLKIIENARHLTNLDAPEALCFKWTLLWKTSTYGLGGSSCGGERKDREMNTNGNMWHTEQPQDAALGDPRH